MPPKPSPSQLSLQDRGEGAPSPAISSRSSSSHPQPPSDIDTTDFKLLHHFTTSTYLTLSDRVEQQYVWQQNAPGLAFSHTFLLRMIFAISALHLSRTTSDPFYLSYAHRQYEEALRSSSAALSAISPSNCHAIYACVGLGFIFELGASNNGKNVLYATNGAIADWAVHVRGVRTIMDSSWHDLQSGVLSPLFLRQFRKGDIKCFENYLNEFVRYVRSTNIGNRDLSTYMVAVQQLVECSKMVEIGFFAWMCQTSDEFAEMLAKHDHFALVILAHSSVLLKYGEPQYWIGGWANKLLSEVQEQLDPSLGVWLEWPFQQVNQTS
ncbi:hypothetical protein N7533_011553 [Penicillium manginii]|jgi:hypothetical protein|uniref:uncharacterized protein n=1 Tax=Penicillium manginii TaxID=203109 RepID=UPI0025485287|nr:uncharacterized protein N7533_011553 [Penicillium manginii]KAJ5742144.1 hypothetical protein N7533_011553 [Penicillium manginii]